jgi:hypothetical protein
VSELEGVPGAERPTQVQTAFRRRRLVFFGVFLGLLGLLFVVVVLHESQTVRADVGDLRLIILAGWLALAAFGGAYWRCPACNGSLWGLVSPRYCPNCAAPLWRPRQSATPRGQEDGRKAS